MLLALVIHLRCFPMANLTREKNVFSINKVVQIVGLRKFTRDVIFNRKCRTTADLHFCWIHFVIVLARFLPKQHRSTQFFIFQCSYWKLLKSVFSVTLRQMILLGISFFIFLDAVARCERDDIDIHLVEPVDDIGINPINRYLKIRSCSFVISRDCSSFLFFVVVLLFPFRIWRPTYQGNWRWIQKDFPYFSVSVCTSTLETR